jgi:hypothetical protein
MNAEIMKGTTVRRLKSYTSWVKYVVRQYGFYLLEKFESNKGSPFVRKELGMVTYGLPVVYMFNINMINNNEIRFFLISKEWVFTEKRKSNKY